MFGIGTGELLLLLVLALLVLGPERMPKLARDIGKTVADLRKTSDELRTEFLNADQMLKADRLLDVAARRAGESSAPSSTGTQADAGATSAATEIAPAAGPQESVPLDAGATPAEAATGVPAGGSGVPRGGSDVPPIPPEPEETEFDREARLARERLEDPERMKEHMERAKAEGWTVPTDHAGTSDREG